MHDLVIENASIIDGRDAPVPRQRGGRGGRITAVVMSWARSPARQGRRPRADARIIDNHTHYDAQITWDPFASPSPALASPPWSWATAASPSRRAVRTIATSSCATSPRGRHVAGRLALRYPVGVRDFSEYLDFLEHRGVGPNAAVFVGHSSVRTWHCAGMRRSAPRSRTKSPRCRHGARGDGGGAVGFSTTTSSSTTARPAFRCLAAGGRRRARCAGRDARRIGKAR